MGKLITTEGFKVWAKQHWNGKHNTFEKVEYISNNSPVIVTCKEHGDWSVTPQDFGQGTICSKCANRSVYVMINSFGLLKIGSSNNPERRRGEVERGSGVKTELLWFRKVDNSYKVETQLHYMFCKNRVEGEWFKDLKLEDITSRVEEAERIAYEELNPPPKPVKEKYCIERYGFSLTKGVSSLDELEDYEWYSVKGKYGNYSKLGSHLKDMVRGVDLYYPRCILYEGNMVQRGIDLMDGSTSLKDGFHTFEEARDKVINQLEKYSKGLIEKINKLKVPNDYQGYIELVNR